MSAADPDLREWLETDGLGGYASGTVSGIRTRGYHAWLLTATRPPTGRVVLVNGGIVHVRNSAGCVPLSLQTREGHDQSSAENGRLRRFTTRPWPTWEFAVSDGLHVRQELFVVRGLSGVALRWSLHGSGADIQLSVAPLLSGRDHHAVLRENPEFDFTSRVEAGRVTWRPARGLPAVVAEHNGQYDVSARWDRGAAYAAERDRGLTFVEDLGIPGAFHWDLQDGPAVLLLGAGTAFSRQFALKTNRPDTAPADEMSVDTVSADTGSVDTGSVESTWADAADREQRRRRSLSDTDRAVESYFVRRGQGTTIIAGYPWFTDWGRDTFIALRGLCLTSGRLATAGEILREWSGTVSEGMLPNRFPDDGETPEFNAVDASLWYIIAVHDYLTVCSQTDRPVPHDDRRRLLSAVHAILEGYRRGTRFGIRCDQDGLIAAGTPGVPLTWMDAKVGDWVVTPRIGKPVEIQALWLNALAIASREDDRWIALRETAERSFRDRFLNPQTGWLNDVVDCDHQPGLVDAALRPNQIFAVGGLPYPLLTGSAARRVVDIVESRLLTPLGLRTLDPQAADYRGHYEGDVWARDAAYHQGTVWPWLLGTFIDAWLRVRGRTAAARAEARDRFLTPLQIHCSDAGLDHVSEIADGDAPHTPRGCPFQAWSLGELLRIEAMCRTPEEDCSSVAVTEA